MIICTLSAQVVNIEKKRTKKAEGGLQGNIDLNFALTETTKQIIQGKNDIKFQFIHKNNTVLFFNNLSLMQIDNEKFLNDGFQHLRYNYNIIKDNLIAEIFVQHQYNSIKKLNRRMLGGFGPRIKIVENENIRIFSGPLCMYEYEELLTKEVHEKWRASIYISLSVDYKQIKINSITYYQPNISETKDYRISSDSSLNIGITDKLSFKSGFSLSFDSQPPEDIASLFYTLNNGVSFTF